MHSTGIRRKVDDLGRIVIPAGIRRSLDINDGDALEVAVDGDKVVLAKPVDRCVFCSADEELSAFRARMVCRHCVAALGVLDGAARGPAEPPAADVAAVPKRERRLTVAEPDERVAGVRDERRAPYDPASSTAW